MGREQIGVATCGSSEGRGEPPLQLRAQQSPCAPGAAADRLTMLPGLSFLPSKTA